MMFTRLSLHTQANLSSMREMIKLRIMTDESAMLRNALR